MKKTIFGAMALCLALGLTGCASTTPTPTAQPTTMAPTQTPTTSPTMEPATPQPTQEATTAPEETMEAGAPVSGEIKNGTYRAEMSEKIAEEEQGWQGYLSLTVKDGAVTGAEFDYTKDDKKKSEATAEEYPMDPPPSEWIPQYEKEVMAAGLTGEKIDTITGATNSAKDVNALYQAVLEAAREGNTETVTVDNLTQESAS